MRSLTLFAVIAVLAVAAVVMLSDDVRADTEMARIGDVYYTSLNDALDHASSGNIVIVLDGCRLSENAEVPAGVTLLLPYSDGRGDVDTDGFEYGPVPDQEHPHRKKAGDDLCVTHLQIDNSARLTVYGNVVIGGIIGEEFTFDYQGQTYGEHGRIVLNGEMVMENGSSLRCYGYITGDGRLTAESGSCVYEPLIITDFVGGDRMRDAVNPERSQPQPPFDRYSFSNIESPMTIEYGARLIGLLNIYADEEMNSSEINIIGIPSGGLSKSLVELTNGSYATVSYDKTRYVEAEWSSNIWNDIGKTTVTVNGGADFDVMIMTYRDHYLDMTNIPFSIPYNFDFILEDGTYNLNADLRILPGASVTVSEDALLIANRNLLIFNGLVDIPYRDKYYPGPELLSDYGFETHGSLYVNGSLQITKDGSVLGVVESTFGNPVITVDSDVAKYKDRSIIYGTGSYTVRKLSLWVCYDDSLCVLEPGSLYVLSFGVTTIEGFTYTYQGNTITKDVIQTYKGRYIPMSDEPVVSMTVSLDNVNISDAEIKLVKGGVEIPMEFVNGRYVTYSAYDGDYSIKVRVSGKDLDAGTVTVKDGKGTATVQLYTVTFLSNGSAVNKDVAVYGGTIVPPVPSKSGFTFNGWYDGKIIFTSRTKVTHKTALDALWGENTAEHVNVTGDMFPVVISDVTEDVTAFFDEGSVRVFVPVNDQSASNQFAIAFTASDDGFRIITKINGGEVEMMKTITVPYNIMRPGATVNCSDGHDVTNIIFDASTQTVTFESSGSAFSITYDPDPEPLVFGSSMDFAVIVLIVTAALAAVVCVIAVICVRRRK